MGCRQCLPLSVVQLKGKHCRKPHCLNGVVGTFRPRDLTQDLADKRPDPRPLPRPDPKTDLRANPKPDARPDSRPDKRSNQRLIWPQR